MTINNFLKELAEKAGIENKEEMLASFDVKGNLPDGFEVVAQRLMSKDAALSNAEIAAHFTSKHNANLTRVQTAKLEAAGFSKDEIKLITDLEPESRTEKIIEIQHQKLTREGTITTDEATKLLKQELEDSRKKYQILEAQLIESTKRADNVISQYKENQAIKTAISSLPLRSDILNKQELVELIHTKVNSHLAQKNAKLKVVGDKILVVNADDNTTVAYDEFNNPMSAEKVFRTLAGESQLLQVQTVQKQTVQQKPAAAKTIGNSQQYKQTRAEQMRQQAESYYQKFN